MALQAPAIHPARGPQPPGSRLVVKLGGEIMQHGAALDALAADVAWLAGQGQEIVLVHGGGPQADALAARLGHRVRKVAGRRVTDDDALDVAKMVYGGSINLDLLAALTRHGARAVGLSGVDGGLIVVARRPLTRVAVAPTGAEEWVDFGHVGDVQSVDIALLTLLLAAGYVPVVASLAADRAGALYNVNADTIATALATALSAARLILLTNVPGILRDPADPASRLAIADVATIGALIADGTISGGMLPKVQNALAAIAAGVRQVLILDGTQPGSLRAAWGDRAAGTLVTADGVTR